MDSEKFAVIGAGFCGLGVMGAFQRHNIPFEAFEADDQIGGNWYHGVYETVHIISSRKTTEYSDFPMPAGYPDFPSAAQMRAYLNAYADHYQLREHIQLDADVERIAPASGDRWELTFKGGERRVYGGVVVATGHQPQQSGEPAIRAGRSGRRAPALHARPDDPHAGARAEPSAHDHQPDQPGAALP
jgi:cation diffusion facilitator CzcD-associated flavoprotein CzcO